MDQRHSHSPRAVAASPYDALKERAAARNRALSESGRDIAELPAVAKPKRKAKAAGDFRFFCETYFPQTFRIRAAVWEG